MAVKAVKIEQGLYSVAIDGCPTDLVIGKGETPRYREPQMWAIGRRTGDETRWVVGDQRGLSAAIETIQTIADAIK